MQDNPSNHRVGPRSFLIKPPTPVSTAAEGRGLTLAWDHTLDHTSPCSTTGCKMERLMEIILKTQRGIPDDSVKTEGGCGCVFSMEKAKIRSNSHARPRAEVALYATCAACHLVEESDLA